MTNNDPNVTDQVSNNCYFAETLLDFQTLALVD